MRLLLTAALLCILSAVRAQVVINELGITPSANNAAGGGEFIELYNAGSCPVNIGCHILVFASASSSSGNANGWTITIPANTILQPCSYYLVGGSGLTPGTAWTTLAAGGNAWSNAYGANGNNAADLDISTSANTGLNGLRPGNLSDSRGQVSLLLPNGALLASVSYSNSTIQGNNAASYTGAFNKAPSGCAVINPIGNPGNAAINITNYHSSTYDGIYLDATGNYQMATSLTPGRSNALLSGGSQTPCVPFPPPAYSVVQPSCVLPTGTITATAVPGFSYSINGTDYSNTTGIFANLPPGTYPLTHRGPSGCTSNPVLVTLVAAPGATVQQQTLSGCQSVTYNGQAYSASTTVRDTLRSINHCDSIIRVVQIEVRPAVHSYPSQCLAVGQSLLFNGQTLTASGTYLDTLVSAQGCDSVVHLRLTVARQESQSLSGCGSLLYNGVTYTASTILRDTLRTSTGGCDSLIRLTSITVRPAPTPTITSACINEGQSYSFHGQTLTATGWYTASLPLASGCDSTVRLYLSVRSVQTGERSGCGSLLFNGQSYTASTQVRDTVRSTVTGCDSLIRVTTIRIGQPSPVTGVTGCVVAGSMYSFFGQSLTQPGVYTHLLTNVSGCDSLIRLTLVSTRQETLRLEGCASVTYGGTVYRQSTTLQERLPSSAGGCDSLLRTVEIRVRDCGDAVYLPSAFTPNGDGLNDDFRLLGGPVATMELSVYNRWGQLVFQSRHRSRGWDGTVGGKAQASGTFVYLLKAELPDGRKVQLQGTVALVR